MDDDEKFFRESYYNIIRILLSIYGLWPYQTKCRRYAIYFGFLLLLGSGMTFEVLGMLDVWSDSLEVVECMPMLVLGILSLIKLIYGACMISKIKVLLVKMQQQWHSPKSNEETRIFHSHVLHGRNLSYVYTGFIVTHIIIFMLATLLTKILSEKPTGNKTSHDTHSAQVGLAYRANYLIDMDAYYIPIFLHISVCEVFYPLILVTFDVLYMMLVLHCCGLLAALRYRLENALEHENDDDSAPVSMRDKTFANMAYSIRRHAEVIQFVSYMESMYRIPLFAHLVANVSVLSFLGFQVITHTSMNRMRHVSYLNALFLNTFFENWPAQIIMDSSMKVYESAYNVKWYKMQAKQRKLLLMIMMRSKKPLTITAGKFIVLSYVTFTTVIRTAMSYFMLLRSIQ